jgi:hypothetical protein
LPRSIRILPYDLRNRAPVDSAMRRRRPESILLPVGPRELLGTRLAVFVCCFHAL